MPHPEWCQAVLHDRVDIERWKAAFALDALRARARESVLAFRAAHPDQTSPALEEHVRLALPRGSHVTSPSHLAVIELLRDEQGARLASAARSPVDVFVFAIRPPARRDTTRVGGAPWWPADAEWPRDARGEPRTFVAQISFADSLDLVPPLPGTLLAIFGTSLEDALGGQPDALEFRWLSPRSMALLDERDVPATGWPIRPCYGAVHRTVDLIGPHDDPAGIDVLTATKIGGEPVWLQGPEPMGPRFLGSIGPVQPAFEVPFPWLDVEEPIEDFGDLYGHPDLTWGDMGILNLFLRADGSVGWVVQTG